MKKYTIKIATEAFGDIQEIINWYNNQKPELGNQFYKKIIKQIDSLKKNPLFMLCATQKSDACRLNIFRILCITTLMKQI